MRWQGRKESSNVEDRRGLSPKGVIGGGIGGIAIILIVMLLGGDPSSLLQNLDMTDQTTTSNYQETVQEKELASFVSVVLAETENIWHKIFSDIGRNYVEPKLVLFSGSVQSACGVAGASTGPFYCPGDQKLYIDLSFYDELQKRFKAPGDFAMAYVVAHEVGHHIQNLLGTMDKIQSLRSRLSEEEYNQYSVRLELQADFYAGVWAHYTDKLEGLLEEGDLDEALNAAAAVGDDNIQKQMQGYVVPESFTHGTSAQRKKWFYKGYTTGDIRQGDTFSARDL
ncbi:MAG TPA: neutral zinc metallopeptidase [Ignavibacteriaceae bacterium]|jgi:predicted metalloprotease|nr:MAG: putative neutral zinc metallopeptidase [Ignavibacteria bacterium ADurb.Bin266]OQY71806.1 MAG: metalloprotease [Ignavibacteriales bacterium UTCHB2]HQF41299.1 neutral zinc metallopeptidase [Ignavibacteriaceae bacterium]HQI41419.1 neutral zinc metallopeptidase [Ignavibacteriaceae bacterium]HQJ45015.1 neutral zinc metallopeptidase [Ignavibacteriaceae bacterium]